MKLLASLLTAAIFAAPAFPAFSAGETPVKADAAKGQASYGAVCAACHAADGNSTIPLQPKLAGQHPEYLVKQLREFKDGKRNDPVMKGFASTLSDGDMQNIAAWLHTQAPRTASPRTRTPSPWVSASTAAAFRSARLPPARAATAPTAPAFRPSTRVCRVSMRITP
jgi:cytochrome c553